MTAGNPLRRPPGDKLRFLAETVLAEVALLRITDGRLFAAPMDADRAASLRRDIDLAERVDAFVARFGRLQARVRHETPALDPKSALHLIQINSLAREFMKLL